MANIRKISPNNYALFNNGESLTGFHKIERVADNSNYYCLWPTPEYFYLYHIAKKKFALNCNEITDANTFAKIEHYSEITGSFIAYRKDEDYAHILFEDGYVESTTFSFIGKETDGARPVKTCSDRWFFYDTRKRKYLHLTGSKGYQIDGCLEKILTREIFIINKNDRGKQLALYVQGKAPVFSRDYFEQIELISYSTLIGKLYNKNIYCIIKNNNIAYPIGYYTSLPKYVREHNLFIAAKGESYCLIKGEKEIQNHQWKSDSFIFHSDYVFNKQCNSSTWKIFSIHNGHEIPTNFKNIRIIDDKEPYLLTEIDGTEKRISIEEIEDISKSFINQIQLKQSPKDPNTTKAEDDLVNCVIDKDLFLAKENNSIVSNNDIEKNSNSHEEAILHDNNVLPNEPHPYINILDSRLSSDISYYVLVNNIKIVDNRIISNINCNCFRGKTFVIWLVSKNSTMVITESRRSKIHTILYLKENSLTVNKAFEYKSFWNNGIVYPINICNSIVQLDNNSFELELLYHIFEDKLEFNNMVNNIQNPEKTKESKQTIKKEEKNLKQNNSYIEFNFTSNEETESVLQKFLSDLKIDKKCNFENIFSKRKFVYSKTSNYICILFDNDTDSIISIKDSIHYHIYGEGKDKKFDHYFGANANSVIRDSINDSQKTVLLFAYENENKISFFDEIKCESYSVVPESENKRNVIIFKFRSLLRNKDIDAAPIEDVKKDDSIYQTNKIAKEEIDKPLKTTNMSKLQELYETREKLQSLGIAPNADLEKQLIALEEESIRDEIIPTISQAIAPILKRVKRKVIFVIEYNPDDGVQVSLSQKKSVYATSNTSQIDIMTKNLATIGANKKLRVTFPDGTIICEKKVIDTLSKVIQRFGIEKVAQLCEVTIDPILKPAGVNLVTKEINPKYEDVQRRVENGWLVFSCTNTLTKKRQIETIADALNTKVSVEII